MSPLNRRDFLTAAAVAGGSALATKDPAVAARRGRRAAIPRAGAVRFSQGVASGQPTQRGITLWTRAAGLERTSRFAVEISPDRDFRKVILRRQVLAEEKRHFTVHERVSAPRLRPGEQYFYRFFTRDSDSVVGRFRMPLPPDSREPVRIGFFSCQDYESGFYTAHDGLAAEVDLDLVVCLGDYIYERSFDENGVRQDRTGRNSDAEVERLSEYREKYALYHSDASLRRLRQNHAMMAIWDDHEVEDNYARDEPGEATESRELRFAARRRNGYRAFFEHMPRLRNRDRRNRIYGSRLLGGNAELILLDERQYRDDQPCGDQIGSANCPEAFAPGRTMLGSDQRRWLKGALDGSRATWKIVGNQVMMMALDSPAGNPLNPDQWDGYKAERRELMEFIRKRRIEDVAFLTGDIHTFFAGEVTLSGRQPALRPAVATEFVVGSMTSKGIADSLGRSDRERQVLADLTDAGVRANNPHIEYSNQQRKGYGVLEARRGELQVEFRAPRSTEKPDSSVFTLQRFRVERGNPRVQVLGPPGGSFPN